MLPTNSWALMGVFLKDADLHGRDMLSAMAFGEGVTRAICF